MRWPSQLLTALFCPIQPPLQRESFNSSTLLYGHAHIFVRQTATDGSYSSGYSDSGSSNQDDSSGGSSQSWTTSTALATATSTYSSQAWTTSAALAAATSSSYASPSYGSGGSSWGNQGDYNSCVQRMLQAKPLGRDLVI